MVTLHFSCFQKYW